VALNTTKQTNKQTNREKLCIFYKWKDADTDRHQVTTVLKEFCLSSAILESVLLKNAI
jgi:hypothetical protein